MSEEKLTLWQEVKKLWMIFLIFGFITTIISAGVSTYVSNKISESMQGPPCRIDFSTEKFPMTNSTPFNMQYLLINLRDKDLLIEGIDSYCVWKTEKEINKEREAERNIIIEQPIIKEIAAPKELENLPASTSQIRTAFGCISPHQEGSYKIKVIVRTTSGNCEGDIYMDVIEEGGE